MQRQKDFRKKRPLKCETLFSVLQAMAVHYLIDESSVRSRNEQTESICWLDLRAFCGAVGSAGSIDCLIASGLLNPQRSILTPAPATASLRFKVYLHIKH